jgi:rod shape-determining protein MreD
VTGLSSGGGRAGRPVVTALVVAALVAGHYAVRPFLPPRVSVGFLLVGVLFLAVRVRPGGAAVAGLVAGLAADASGALPLGTTSLVWIALAFLAARTRAVLFGEQAVVAGVAAFGASWVGDLLLALARPSGTSALSAASLGVWSQLGALLTAGLAIGVHLLARDASRPGGRSGGR